MQGLKVSDYVFIGLALAVALGGIFVSEYYRGDYALGALAASIGIVILWILYDAAGQRGWWGKIRNFLSDDRCNFCGGHEYQWIGATFRGPFIWVHFYCLECKRFYSKLMPMPLQEFHKDIF